MDTRESDLVYDWNQGAEGTARRPRLELEDETLRDGLQSTVVRDPSVEEKRRILHMMVELGIEGANIGLPAAGPAAYEHVEHLAREIVTSRLPIQPTAAARTLIADIEPIVEISQKTGVAIEIGTFVGSSPIRQHTKGWTIDDLLRWTEKAVSYGTRQGLPVMFVTEDTTRSRPEDLRRLYTAAVEAGARRVCVADTVGYSTPHGARQLVSFVRQIVDATGERVKVDWHGHRDRDLATANALAAAEAGVDRLHGTALGIGERVGDTPMEILLVNLVLLGWRDKHDLVGLVEYCNAVVEATGAPFPENYPMVGEDAFSTASGVHADVILWAREKGDAWLADRVYSSVPASLLGRQQGIKVGLMSGESNVRDWLQSHGYPLDDELIEAVFTAAKSSVSVFTDEELHEICLRHQQNAPTPV